MADNDETEAQKPKGGLMMPLIIGLLLAVLGGGGGFYVAWAGLFPPSESQAAAPEAKAKDLPDIAFVPVAPITVSLGGSEQSDHLRFRAELEVPQQYKAEVELILPRVIDVLNSYLRALDVSDLNAPAALLRLRAQMLRRVQIVTGPERVNDLLVMEFVLN